MNKASIYLILMSSLALTSFTQTTEPSTAGDPAIYEGLIFGIGTGTFAVVCFIILSMFMIFFKNCSNTPIACACCAVFLPLIVFLIILAMPKEDKDPIPVAD